MTISLHSREVNSHWPIVNAQPVNYRRVVCLKLSKDFGGLHELNQSLKFGIYLRLNKTILIIRFLAHLAPGLPMFHFSAGCHFICLCAFSPYQVASPLPLPISKESVVDFVY